MNGMEYDIAVSTSGLMQLGIDMDTAFSLIEQSDYCVNADWSLVIEYLTDILENGIRELHKPTDLPEDLFEI